MGITDANSAGFVHGGMVMKLCDEVAGLAAIKHSSRRVVTAGVDRMTFLDRVLVGEVVTVRATVNAAWRTSMEVGVRVEAEDPFSGDVRHTSSAYLTMVAIDDEGSPTAVPPLSPTNAEEQRREQEAQARRRNRLAEREQRLSRARPRGLDDPRPEARQPLARHRRRRPFRLRRGERIPDGVRRIAGEQVDMAIAQLDGKTAGEGDGVHEARKALKRLRAAVRLARAGLGDDVYRRENAIYRAAGRRLAGARDAQVLVETLDRTLSDQPGAANDLGPLREALVRQRDEPPRSNGAHKSAEVVYALRAARERVDAWPLTEDDFAALAPGLQRIYRRGRRALKVARRDPSDDHLHELRKRAKDLWHVSQLLRPASPKRMRALATDLHALTDRLGEAQDLAMLLAWAGQHRHLADSSTLARLEGLVGPRRAKLQADALRRAQSIYARKPAVFVKRLGRHWEQRAASPVTV
jgi:acyl-CoA hydrolase/CHAD domain-containing protein